MNHSVQPTSGEIHATCGLTLLSGCHCAARANEHYRDQNPLAKLGSTSNCVFEPYTTLPVPKTPKNQSATEENAVAADAAPAAAEPASRASKKRAKPTKTTAAKKTGAKKKPVSSGAKKSAPKRRSAPAEAAEPSDADIRLRAYFIAERRVQLALQGDPARDWIEAREQLLEEARKGQS